MKLSGQIEFVMSDGAPRFDSATILAAMRDALVRRGVAVAETDGFQSYDLELVVPPMIRAPINALRKDASIALIWRIRPDPRRALIAAAVVFLVLLAAGFSLGAGIVGIVSSRSGSGVGRDHSCAPHPRDHQSAAPPK